MPKYTRLTWTDRLVIEKLYNSGATERDIARCLGRAPSGIHYELQRGFYNHLDGATYEYVKRYSADVAQSDADYQATSKGQTIKLGNHYDYAQKVAERVKQGESPDTIAGSLKANGEWTVSATTLYRYIDNNYIPGISNADLREKSKKKHHATKNRKAARAPKGPSLENRPKVIDDRETLGHWEQDTVIGKAEGKGEALLVLTERVSRQEIIRKLDEKTMDAVTDQLTDIVASYPPGTFLTITVDNGSENQNYAGMKTLVNEVYYCHPYSSWERGSNENQNRLIRRYFPKHQSMKDKTQADADAAAKAINNMPRKVLGYRSSQQVFDEWQARLKAGQHNSATP